jgi:hypothetical protein
VLVQLVAEQLRLLANMLFVVQMALLTQHLSN